MESKMERYYLKKQITFSFEEEWKAAGDRLKEYLYVFYGIIAQETAEKAAGDIDIVIKKEP